MILKRYESANFIAEQDSSHKISVINKKTHQIVLSSFANHDLSEDQVRMFADFAEDLVTNEVFVFKKKVG